MRVLEVYSGFLFYLGMVRLGFGYIFVRFLGFGFCY